MTSQSVALQQWALPQMSELLPLDQSELKQILSYTETLPDSEAAKNLGDLLGDSPQAMQFITSFNERRAELNAGAAKHATDSKDHPPAYAPPPGPPPPSHSNQGNSGIDAKQKSGIDSSNEMMSTLASGSKPLASGGKSDLPPGYAPPAGPPPANGASRAAARNHTNQVVEAAKVRARDEVRSAAVPL